MAEKYHSYLAYEKAIEAFETLLQMYFDNNEEHYLYLYPFEYLAFAYLNIGQKDKAEDIFKLYCDHEDLNNNSSSIFVAMKLAVLLHKLGK